MTEPERKGRPKGTLIGIGAILGVGIGAMIGSFTDGLATGIWVGAIIGVGLGMLADYFAT